jgi:hypothetical protein
MQVSARVREHLQGRDSVAPSSWPVLYWCRTREQRLLKLDLGSPAQKFDDKTFVPYHIPDSRKDDDVAAVSVLSIANDVRHVLHE